MPTKQLTKEQAAKKAGISLRSLERYTSQGKIAVGYRAAAKGKQAFYEQADVERLRDELKAGRGAVVLPPERREIVRQGPTEAPGEALASPAAQALIDGIIGAFRGIRMLPAGDAGPQAGRPSLSIADKLALTIPEAAALVGSSGHRIRAAIHAGELKAMKDTLGRGWRIKRADLEEWLAGL